jgi:hypothetical protein
MTRDEVRELFDALITPGMEAPYDQDCEEDISALERAFTAAVAAEREACAKLADIEADNPHGSNPGCATAESIAAEIRARGEK